MYTKLDRMMIYLECLPIIKFFDSSHVILQDYMKMGNHYIFVIVEPMFYQTCQDAHLPCVTPTIKLLDFFGSVVNELGRMVTCLEKLPSIRSHDHLVSWSCEERRQTKIIINTLLQFLWPPNMVGCWLTLRQLLPIPLVTWYCKIARSHEKLKSLCFPYQRPYCH